MPEQARPVTEHDIARGIATLIDPTTAEGNTEAASAEAGDEVTDEAAALSQATEQADTVEAEDEVTEDDEGAESTDESGFELVLQRHGEEYRVVDRDEATRLAQLGLHFTKKNEEVLALERAVSDERTQVAQLRTQYTEALPMIQEYLKAPLGERPKRDQFKTVDEYDRALQAWDQGTAQVEAVRQEHERLQQEQQQQANEALQKFLAESDAQTLALIPEWTDQSVLATEVPVLRKYALDQGIPEAWFANPWVSRVPGFLAVLRKAWQFEDASARGKSTVEEVKQKTKDAAPGPGGEQAVNQRAKNLRDLKKDVRERGGNARDVSVLMESLLDRQSQLKRTG